jgi:predicted transcriptional regulator
MKSVRLDPAMETKLREAARLEGVTESALIRQAIEQRCDAILSFTLDAHFHTYRLHGRQRLDVVP